MQLLDRYLTAIKFWLPKKQRDDIAAELAANLQSEIDDRAAERGRPLTDEEIGALLKQHGSPILVASRYQGEHRTVTVGRQLIGPLLFPFYWIAVKVSLVLLLIPAIVPSLVLNPTTNLTREIGHVFYRSLGLALPTLFFLTLAFAAIDAGLRKFHLLEKWTTGWEPSQLPSRERQAKQVRRSSSIAGIIVQSIFILWWMGHTSLPYLVVSGSGATIHSVPLWASLHLPILVIAFVCLAQHWINLAQPNWRWLPPLTGLGICLGSLVWLYPLLQSSPLLTITIPNGGAGAGHAAMPLNQVISISLEWLWLGIALVGAIHAWRLAWVAWDSLPRTTTLPRNGASHGISLI